MSVLWVPQALLWPEQGTKQAKGLFIFFLLLLLLTLPITWDKQPQAVELARVCELAVKVPGSYLAGGFLVADKAETFTSQCGWGISVNVSCFGKSKPARRCGQILFPLLCHHNFQRATPSPPPSQSLLQPNEIQLLPRPPPTTHQLCPERPLWQQPSLCL